MISDMACSCLNLLLQHLARLHNLQKDDHVAPPASRFLIRAMHPRNNVTALLGPTNTGKTHHAVERMLGHPNGMIGLPLRLLAREIYDRVVARTGQMSVALVTGEENSSPLRRVTGYVPLKPCRWTSRCRSSPLMRFNWQQTANAVTCSLTGCCTPEG